MKYIKFIFNIGYSGINNIQLEQYPDYITSSEIEEEAAAFFEDFCESYAHLRFGWDMLYTEDEYKGWIKKCSYNWEEITRKEFMTLTDNED